MTELLISSSYLLIGACWVSVADEYIFTEMTNLHKLISLIAWPIDIVMGGITSID